MGRKTSSMGGIPTTDTRSPQHSHSLLGYPALLISYAKIAFNLAITFTSDDSNCYHSRKKRAIMKKSFEKSMNVLEQNRKTVKQK